MKVVTYTPEEFSGYRWITLSCQNSDFFWWSVGYNTELREVPPEVHKYRLLSFCKSSDDSLRFYLPYNWTMIFNER